MTFTTLVSTETLARHLEDADWVLVDCRFELQASDWGREDYRRAHIPGAVYAHLDQDLSSPITSTSGRHPLPDPGGFIARLSAWGIEAGKQVVAYDTVGGAYAARLWWLLRYFGHAAVAVLDGGFTLWEGERRPTRAGDEARPAANFTGKPAGEDYFLTTERVNEIRSDPHYRLIDARSRDRYLGEHEPIDPVAGHIPGAVDRFHARNLKPDRTFQPPEKLRAEFLALLSGVEPENSVVYCGSGVTSCHHLLAMEVAGLPGARLYPGSWSEWIRDPERPVATGPEMPQSI